jgi:hypothetical protein
MLKDSQGQTSNHILALKNTLICDNFSHLPRIIDASHLMAQSQLGLALLEDSPQHFGITTHRTVIFARDDVVFVKGLKGQIGHICTFRIRIASDHPLKHIFNLLVLFPILFPRHKLLNCHSKRSVRLLILFAGIFNTIYKL